MAIEFGENRMTWWLVSAIGIAALKSFFFRGRNAVWGGATLGAIIGVVVAIFQPGFEWATVGHGAVIGSFVGLIAELLGAIGDRMKRSD
jgi:hypothetical protein